MDTESALRMLCCSRGGMDVQAWSLKAACWGSRFSGGRKGAVNEQLGVEALGIIHGDAGYLGEGMDGIEDLSMVNDMMDSGPYN